MTLLRLQHFVGLSAHLCIVCWCVVSDVSGSGVSAPSSAPAPSGAQVVEQLISAELHLFRQFLKAKMTRPSRARNASAGSNAMKRVKCVCVIAVPSWATLK